MARDFYRTARCNAFCAMSTTSSRMSDARPRAYGTPPGSPERVALHDLRTRMDDLRVALSIAGLRGELEQIDRNGYRRPVDVPAAVQAIAA